MHTYLIHITNPKYPNDIKRVLEELKAKQFEDGFVVESNENIRTLFIQVWQWVRKQGFLYMIDSEFPELFVVYPVGGQSRFPQLETRLDTLRLQFREHFPSKNGTLPD